MVVTPPPPHYRYANVGWPLIEPPLRYGICNSHAHLQCGILYSHVSDRVEKCGLARHSIVNESLEMGFVINNKSILFSKRNSEYAKLSIDWLLSRMTLK